MAVLTSEDIKDLVSGTLRELGRMRLQQIAQNLQHYEVVGKWFSRDKVQFDSGIGIQRTLMTTLSKAAKHVGLLDTDDVVINDVISQFNIPWRQAQTAWGFIYQEILQNRGESLIFNIIVPRRADAMISLAEELEDKAWSSPSSTDKTDPYGLPYWLPVDNSGIGNTVQLSSKLPEGGHTTVGGIDPTTTVNFRHYAGDYDISNLSKTNAANVVKLGRKLHRLTGWRSPITIDDYRGEGGQKFRIYVDEALMSTLEDIGEGQNENLGRDLAPIGGARDFLYVDHTLTFRKHPVIWVPHLDSSTFTSSLPSNRYHPMFFVDHSVFYPVCLSGDFLREGDPREAPNNHNVYRVFVDLTYNYLCVDRRRCGVLASTVS